MSSEEPDASKYVLGGCSISDEMPDYRCINCATDFYKDTAKFHSRFISDEMPDYRCINCATDFYEDTAKFHSRFVSDGSGISFQCKKCKEWIPAISEIDWHECKRSQSKNL